MAERTGSQIERLYCHKCEAEFPRARHGLECPQCQSEFVELIEEHDDPRGNRTNRDGLSRENSNTSRPDLPSTPNHPWSRDSPDGEEGDIEHVEWNAGPGLRFSRTSYRTSTSGQHMNDPFAPVFQSFSTIMESPPGSHPNRLHFPPNFEPFNPPRGPTGHGSTPNSPLREGPPIYGSGRHTVTSTTRVWPRDGSNDRGPVPQVDQLQGLLGSLLQSLNTVHGMNTSGNHPTLGGPPASFPFQFLTQLLNPANAASGDAVYTEEALDRVITQFMEQANGSSAPGPASAEAIQGLPKKKVDKSMMGSDGKAECSVCMDSVEIGDEITVLPCSHWFHGDCVGAWLKEHDTCPHCRQGIMPKENAGGRGHSHAHAHAHVHTPRGPRQPAQRQATPPPPPPLPPPSFSNGSGANMTHGLHFSWQPGSPPVARQMELPLRPSEHHRRRSTPREGRNGGEGSGGGGRGGGGGGGGREGGGGGSERGGGREREGGFGNWMRDRWSRTNGDRH